MPKLTAFLFILIVTTTCVASAEEVAKPFSAKDYRRDFSVSQKELRNGDAVITVIQVKNINEKSLPAAEPNYCRAWVTVQDNRKQTFADYYADMDPNGGLYGIFKPKLQPPAPWLALIKQGDYDGQLILIKADGQAFKYPGGSYVISPDRRFLFSKHDVDDSSGEVNVIDLSSGKSIHSTGDENYSENWFSDGNTVYYSHGEDAAEGEKPNTLFKYDAGRNQFTKVILDKKTIASFKKLDDRMVGFDDSQFCIIK